MARPSLGLRRDTSGSVAVTTVLATGMVFGMATLSLDASRFYLMKRSQQAVTDLAAVAAAANIGSARAAAAANLAANGVPAANLASVELGTYAADPTVAAAQRFTTGGANPNAARVTLRSTASAMIGALAGTINATIGTRSVAVNANVAAFALGSSMASLDNGLINAVLGGLTHSTLSLSVLDYTNIASANVDLFGIANALAARIGATGTYASLAATTVRVADVVAAAADAGAANGMSASTIAALRAMATAIGQSGPSIAFGSLVGFGAYANLSIGSAAPVAAAMPLLALVTAAARLGGGTAAVSTNIGVSSLTVLAASVKLAIGAAPVGSSYATIGPVGLTLHTAQTRLLLTVTLAQLGIITALNLPLYVEVAPATATLSAVGCSAGARVDPAATLSVSPGAVDGWIGTVSDAMLTNMTSPVSASPAALTSVTLPPLATLAISAGAHVTVSNNAATSVPFTRAEIAAGTRKRTSTTDFTSSLLGGLFGSSLQLTATQTVLGITGSATVPSVVTSAIGTLLTTALTPVDGLLSNTLASLGITVGDADTWVLATRCGQGALVN